VKKKLTLGSHTPNTAGTQVVKTTYLGAIQAPVLQPTSTMIYYRLGSHTPNTAGTQVVKTTYLGAIQAPVLQPTSTIIYYRPSSQVVKSFFIIATDQKWIWNLNPLRSFLLRFKTQIKFSPGI